MTTPTHNTISFFRFSDQWEDVFEEDGRYLYACAEPHGWAYMFCVNEYTVLDDDTLLRGSGSSADVQYLEKLTPAPLDVAARIIKAEAIVTAKYDIQPTDDTPEAEEEAENEREAYLEYKAADVDETVARLKAA